MPRQQFSRIGFTAAFIASGIAHFLTPRFFIALIPKAIPGRPFWVYISGLVELVLAVGLWQRRWQKLAAQGTLALMLLFLPLHIADIFREKPVAGGRKDTAVLRLLAQFGLIALAKELATHEADPPN
ncbi:MauE/DoxX family redox-associated membrane protein [Candidatus Leptofilum sp.]|uniref:DoxX family protein n=1 Tax=Candidatus Leptofilum sp. TaxID=3241576 RepID=UPI003B5C228B